MAISGMDEIFDGRFRIQKNIGSGNFSVVFCVLDSDDNRRYVIFLIFYSLILPLSFFFVSKESIKNHQKKQSYKRRVQRTQERSGNH